MEIFPGLKPDFESTLFEKGYKRIVGIDEVGRGAWAGPLVLGAFSFTQDSQILGRINDSKKVTKLQREKLFSELMKNGEIFEVEVERIDEMGIGAATEFAVQELIKKLHRAETYFLLDGNFPGLEFENFETVVDGDAKIYSIACASILAKVYRDNLMKDLGTEFPEYGFEKHVGYGTKEHMAAIQKTGVTPHHRRSFKPISKIVSNSLEI